MCVGQGGIYNNGVVILCLGLWVWKSSNVEGMRFEIFSRSSDSEIFEENELYSVYASSTRIRGGSSKFGTLVGILYIASYFDINSPTLPNFSAKITDEYPLCRECMTILTAAWHPGLPSHARQRIQMETQV